MYEAAAVIAAFLVVYTAFSAWVDRSWLSGPVVFVAMGAILGPAVLGWFRVDSTADLRVLAEATLAMILFTDAANADFAVVKRNLALPGRLLLIGLPLTIVLGFLAVLVVFPGLDLLLAALIAAILAPTDAALGKPVVTNPGIDVKVREGLNLESGLNDGICVPVVLILLELVLGTRVEGHTAGSVLLVVVEELGIGLAVGVAATGCAILLLRATVERGLISETWMQVPVVAVAVVCYAAAQALGGSGFIACFVGGLLVSWFAPRRKHDLLHSAEWIGETLAMLTWLAFGAIAVGQMLELLDVSVLLYAVLSLTVVRMVPVFFCLLGTGMSTASKLFIGWFGPRGLASIVFAIIVSSEQFPGNSTLKAVVVGTVLLSVLAHGVTANPLVAVLRARTAAARDAPLAAGPA